MEEQLEQQIVEQAVTGRACAKCGRIEADERVHHCPCGSLLPGATIAMKTGLHSHQVRTGLLPEQAEALAALAERRAGIESDLGGDEQLSALTRDMVGRYLELTLVADYLGQKLVTEGPLTTKGRQRAALTAFLGVVDRLQRLAVILGFERQQKRATSFLDAVRSREGK